jgi:predicted nucleotidyltransferase
MMSGRLSGSGVVLRRRRHAGHTGRDGGGADGWDNLCYSKVMRKADALSILRANASALQAIGVAHLALFGSVARDEAGADSDIDLVISGPPERPMTLVRMARAQEALERLLGRKVDLIAAQGLAQAPEMRARIAADLAPAF